MAALFLPPFQVTFTPAAVGEVNRLRQAAQAIGEVRLRLALRSGGCQALTYDLRFDGELQPGDRTCVGIPGHQGPASDLEVVASDRDWLALTGLVVDYSEDLVGGAFRFQNPNAALTCHCSNSFDPLPRS